VIDLSSFMCLQWRAYPAGTDRIYFIVVITSISLLVRMTCGIIFVIHRILLGNVPFLP